MSLQSIVDEILMKQEGKKIKKLSEKSKVKVTPFLTRTKSMINANRDTSNRKSSDQENGGFIKDMGIRNDLAENDEFITNDDL